MHIYFDIILEKCRKTFILLCPKILNKNLKVLKNFYSNSKPSSVTIISGSDTGIAS